MYEDLFYNRLNQLRTEKGVSARDMSLSIGQNPGYINGLENRKGLPSMAVFFYICDYLGVTPKEFFEDGAGCSLQHKELLQATEDFDAEQLLLLTALARYMKK